MSAYINIKRQVNLVLKVYCLFAFHRFNIKVKHKIYIDEKTYNFEGKIKSCNVLQNKGKLMISMRSYEFKLFLDFLQKEQIVHNILSEQDQFLECVKDGQSFYAIDFQEQCVFQVFSIETVLFCLSSFIFVTNMHLPTYLIFIHKGIIKINRAKREVM